MEAALTSSQSSLVVFLSHLVHFLPGLAIITLFLHWSSDTILSFFWFHIIANLPVWTPSEPQPTRRRLLADAAFQYKAIPVLNCGFMRQRGGHVLSGESDAEERCCCPVCLLEIADADDVRELRCEHLFHRACLDRWVTCGSPTCPLCRKPLMSPGLAAEAGEGFGSLELLLLRCVCASPHSGW